MKRQRKSSGRPRTRVRTVSFHDIEAISEARDTEFKRDVRYALSDRVKFPLDEMIQQEEELEEEKREIQHKRRFNRIVKYAGLTPKQLACYKLWNGPRNWTLTRIAGKLGSASQAPGQGLKGRKERSRRSSFASWKVKGSKDLSQGRFTGQSFGMSFTSTLNEAGRLKKRVFRI